MLDRASHLRGNVDRLMAALDAPGTLLVPLLGEAHLVTDGAAPRAAMLRVAEAGALVDAASEIAWLGLVDGVDCFALDLAGLPDPPAHPAIVGRGSLADLRLAGGLVPVEDAELLAYARGLLLWHRRARFCGSCGGPTRPREGGHVRECVAEDLKHFPRTDPAVMVLVESGDRCVLARQASFPKGMFAAVAGFVEPGEPIEAAARREVMEEIGVEVSRLDYVRSQPWPFPASLMLGFRAQAVGVELTVDHSELEEARWFHRDELRSPQGFFLPPLYSLAHVLIEGFLDPAPR